MSVGASAPALTDDARTAEAEKVIQALYRALDHHIHWCGFKEDAPGHPSFNEAKDAVFAYYGASRPPAPDVGTDLIAEADRIFKRLTAPCPQCHTVGDVPSCPTPIHHLPNEALADINRWRGKASRPGVSASVAPLVKAIDDLYAAIMRQFSHHTLGPETAKAWMDYGTAREAYRLALTEGTES